MSTLAAILLLLAIQASPAKAAYHAIVPDCGDIERGCAAASALPEEPRRGVSKGPANWQQRFETAAAQPPQRDRMDEGEDTSDGDGDDDDANPDPIEGINRHIFWFNDHLDQYVLEPVARGWDFIAPDKVQECVANFFDNIRFPVVAINNVLQGKLVPAASDVGRFAINTTAGLAGFFDPASKVGLIRHEEDFGQTLGVWGVPPGAFLTIPVLGPLTLRDGVGYLVDIPLAVYPLFLGFEYTLPARVVSTVNWRAQSLEQIENAKEASVDYYVFVRDAYLQHREALIKDSEDTSEDLYYDEEQDADDGDSNDTAP